MVRNGANDVIERLKQIDDSKGLGEGWIILTMHLDVHSINVFSDGVDVWS
jgi:hypothetical protein